MGIKAKALTLSLLAAIAVGAVGAISATAETGGDFTFDAEGSWTHIEGEEVGETGENEFFFPDLETGVTCTTVLMTGSANNDFEPAITLAPTYVDCHPTTGGTAKVTVNGCDFSTTVGDFVETQHQTVHLSCPTGNEVTIDIDPPIVGVCTVHIPAQTPKGGAVYITGISNGKHDLTARMTLKEMTNTKTETGFGCLGTAGESTNLDLSSTITLRGRDTSFNSVNMTAITTF